MAALPTLFVSHGAPTFALDPGSTGAAIASLAARLPRPKAILAVSSHWETAASAVSAATAPETIHDFYGFPEPLYQLRYPAPGAPWLAERVAELLGQANLPIAIDGAHGLDHGAWVPLLHMWPKADIPVVQLSIQTHLGAAHHYAVGQALAPLADDGVLILGSGGITHNLREFRMSRENESVAPYVAEFCDWLADRLAADDTEAVVDYRTRAPHAVRAHPSEDHFLPLFVAYGAASGGQRHERVHAAVTYGVIGMDAYMFAAERLDSSLPVAA
jgi:4,5-DOPA dioxygenase extradiol